MVRKYIYDRKLLFPFCFFKKKNQKTLLYSTTLANRIHTCKQKVAHCEISVSAALENTILKILMFSKEKRQRLCFIFVLCI